MDKYISVDEFIKQLKSFCYSKNQIIEKINNMPSNEVINLVRCSDCKHLDWETAEPIISNGIASATCWCDSFKQFVRVDGFCSRGKEKAE